MALTPRTQNEPDGLFLSLSCCFLGQVSTIFDHFRSFMHFLLLSFQSSCFSSISLAVQLSGWSFQTIKVRAYHDPGLNPEADSFWHLISVLKSSHCTGPLTENSAPFLTRNLASSALFIWSILTSDLRMPVRPGPHPPRLLSWRAFPNSALLPCSPPGTSLFCFLDGTSALRF